MAIGRPEPILSDNDFHKYWTELGPAEMHRRGMGSLRALYGRRRRLEGRIGYSLDVPNRNRAVSPSVHHPQRVQLDIRNGVVLVGSDAHVWPGPMSVGMRAFIKFCKMLEPSAVILNGDVMDFPKISRHPPIGWENQPTPQEEIEAAQEQLALIQNASPRKSRWVWTLGNHCARFETRLATVAPEYAKVAGVHLRDHFPSWEPAWSVFINNDVVVKHRMKSGVHAPHNNTMWAGRTMVTGHLHSQKVNPLTDYNGTRWGVDTGCLADVDARAFVDYTEDGPKNWRSGFGVLTFVDGQLLPPELVSVWGSDSVVFRGQIIEVPHEASKATSYRSQNKKADRRRKS